MRKSKLPKAHDILFSEIQFSPVWHALLALLVTSSLGIAYGSAVSIVWGWSLGIGLSCIALFWWYKKSVKIQISSESFRVGNFKIENRFVGDVEHLDAAEFLMRIRSGAHRNDVFVLRNYANGGVVLEIKDSRDPFCHWVISSKHPSKLANVINAKVRSHA